MPTNGSSSMNGERSEVAVVGEDDATLIGGERGYGRVVQAVAPTFANRLDIVAARTKGEHHPLVYVLVGEEWSLEEDHAERFSSQMSSRCMLAAAYRRAAANPSLPT